MDNNQASTLEEELDLRRFWTAIYRRKWTILAFTVVLGGLAAFLTTLMPNVYRASTTILIESQQANVVQIEEVYGLDARARQYFETQWGILASRPLAERVARELDLVSQRDFAPKQPWWQAYFPSMASTPVDAFEDVILDYLENRLVIEPVGNTQLVTVHFDSGDPKLAAAVANAHARAYIDSTVSAGIEITDSAQDWMSTRLADLKRALDESEVALQEFQEGQGVVDVEGLRSVPAQQIEELTTRLSDARSRLAQAETAYAQVRDLRTDNEATFLASLEGIPAVMNDTEAQSLRQVAAAAQQRVAGLTERYGPLHPTMIEAQSELRTARENLAERVRNIVRSVENEYSLVSSEERTLAGALERAKGEYLDLGRKESAFSSLQREVETNRRLYDLFYERYKEMNQTGDLRAPRARVIAPAVVPVTPASPDKVSFVAVGALAGLLLAVLAAVLLEIMNDTIKDPSVAERKLRLPFLGIVPLVKGRDKNPKAIAKLFFNPRENQFVESIRSIRTEIDLLQADKRPKVIMVTSAGVGEGKSGLATNLAHAFAQTEHVLLIDADLRRGEIDLALDLRPSPGLAAVLGEEDQPLEECIVEGERGQLELVQQDVIVKTREPAAPRPVGQSALTTALGKLRNTRISAPSVSRVRGQLDVLPAGRTPRHPLQLLSSNRLPAILRALREKYDRIIIDTPPVLSVTDSEVIAKHTDAVVFAVRAEVTLLNDARHALDQLRRVKAPLSGTVLTQFEAPKNVYYGYRWGSDKDKGTESSRSAVA